MEAIIFFKEAELLSRSPKQEEFLSDKQVHGIVVEASWADGQTGNDERDIINFPWWKLSYHLEKNLQSSFYSMSTLTFVIKIKNKPKDFNYHILFHNFTWLSCDNISLLQIDFPSLDPKGMRGHKEKRHTDTFYLHQIFVYFPLPNSLLYMKKERKKNK